MLDEPYLIPASYSYDSETPAFSSCFSMTMALAVNSRLSDSTLIESAREPDRRATSAP